MSQNQRFAVTLIIIFFVVIPLSCGLIGLAVYAISSHPATAMVIDNQTAAPVGALEEKNPVSVSCVQRMMPGDYAEVFTETWDSETRVWVHKDGGKCECPYCYSYDSCENPTVTLTQQPFWTGHELNPVNGKPFEICYDFKGDCSR